MNYIREKISGKKNRLKQDNYNLDLTYITNRIIAMSYPASGFEKIYRNPINEVSNYLNEYHDINYLVINLSGRKYDYQKFNKMVLEFSWEDHHAPQLQVLFQICDLIHKYLLKDIKNVVVIHCLAGKGRTGTAICCYLMYCGRFKNSNDALLYYAKKRFKVKGLGVTQPCQIRYVQYFEKLFKFPNFYPTVKYIKQIQMYPRPSFQGKNNCKPYIKLFNYQNSKPKLIYTSKENTFSKDKNQYINFQQKPILVGDTLIHLKNNHYYYKNLMFRITFNIAFVENNEIVLQLCELEPDSTMFDSRFDHNFQVKIQFEDFCKCNNQNIQKCENCNNHLQLENKNWGIIQEIISQYEQPSDEVSSQLLFAYQSLDDIDEFLKEHKQKMTCQNQSQTSEWNLMHQMFDSDELDRLQKIKIKTQEQMRLKEQLIEEIKRHNTEIKITEFNI